MHALRACFGHGAELIRRHLKECPHPSTYRRCRSPIHVYGTLGGHTIRRALDQTSWDAAAELINGWTASGEIGVVKAEAPTVRDAITKFLADCDARYLGWEAKRKYRHLLEDRLLSWCDSKGRSNRRHLTVDALRQFRQSWKDSQLYATKNLERLRAFLRFCQQAGWIKQNPATSVKPPKVTASPTLPFSRDEMKRILKACDCYGGNKERIRAFVLIMRFTGLRIRDAIRVEALEKAESGSERYFWTGANIRSAVLGLPWGVGIIVGAILAPTDPVLASDVQVEHPFDQNRLRFALTSEASLNDGTAFPFLMLGLGLLGLHDLGSGLWRWVAIDVLWATTGGLGAGEHSGRPWASSCST